MSKHVIVGAGPVGGAVARELLDRGEQVVVVTRSGSGIDGAERVRSDANDAARLAEIAEGAAGLYNCVNPPYHRWAQEWPGVSDALLAAAASSGAVLATTGNLYGYGRVDAPMTELTPLAATGTKGKVRNQMWRDALAAHEAGRVRAFEVRGSDYLGGNSLVSQLLAPAWRKGKRAMLPADIDQPHTFTEVRDVARLLVTGVSDERAPGRVWHVPSPDAITLRELAAITAAQMGVEPRVVALPYAAVWLGGFADKFVKELRETQHQFRRPFVLDSSLAQETFALKPESVDEAVRYDLANNPG